MDVCQSLKNWKHLGGILNSVIAKRLAIGCAQFGLPYGVTNKVGRVAPSEVAKILDYAKGVKISTLDTAISYGMSESVLGKIGVSDWSIISKLPPLPNTSIDVHSWVVEEVNASLNRLNITCLDGLLLHNPQDLIGVYGRKIVEALDFLRAAGMVKKVGISIYQPLDLHEYLNVMIPDIVQCPFSVLDHRLVTSGWAERLNKKNIEIHIRSIFLQGLLLVENSQRPPYFSKWQQTWDRWDLILKESNLSPIEACLNGVMFNELFHKVIIGINDLSHIVEIMNCCNFEMASVMEDISINDINLLHPSNWS
jgi:aryl-alcohol dehydrogenase-like predicted oxidoreductase